MDEVISDIDLIEVRQTLCKHFGKGSDHLVAEEGMTWALHNCYGCIEEDRCHEYSKIQSSASLPKEGET